MINMDASILNTINTENYYKRPKCVIPQLRNVQTKFFFSNDAHRFQTLSHLSTNKHKLFRLPAILRFLLPSFYLKDNPLGG